MPCTTILVGKKASNDGSTIICRNDDGSFETKKVVVVPACKEKQTYKCVISHLNVELEENAMRYTSIPNVNLKNGLWATCGINEENVAMTATETVTSNPRVMGADPYIIYKKEEVDGKTVETAGGIGEEDLLCITLPFIHSAKEGVIRVGQLLEKYGTYEPNGMAFSDENDIWWLETIGGHHWIARKVDDEEVVVMPNQFGLDRFDFEDAYGAQLNNMCSKDLKEFISKYHLDRTVNGSFNPRLAFGSRSDADHAYNTPRAWFMGRYLAPRTYKWDGCNADYTPESDDIPWSFKPEAKVSVQDLKYLLSSYYQGTELNPYGKSEDAGKYRPIGVPNSDSSHILQIRNGVEDALKGLEWITLGGGTFTAVVPIYTNVSKLPAYFSETKDEVSTDYFYWNSRLIAALVDAHYGTNLVNDERYVNRVFNQGHQLVYEYDQKFESTKDLQLLEEANDKIIAMLQKETSKTLGIVLENASNHMKTRFYRSDN